ncbi:MAG: ABC transporter ATP-binding protein [Candidatus Promineifilaceae bacterium]|jgi:ABC-2 type transport system ATP-binding protein
MIRTNGLSKRFGDFTAVDNLTLEIDSGEVFGFLGPNGAGKTTTVRMLTCLIEPSAGQASVLGYQVGQEDQQIRRSVGLLTETPGHYDRLSAWQNLTIYARLYEVEQVERQVEKYLRLLDLWERRQDPAGSFSKGMRQKLAIARTLLHEPQVLFLDEPTAGLDPQAAHLIREFIEELKEEGRTIFICTHNLDEADRLCDRVAVFKQNLRVVDAPANLRRQVYGRRISIQLAQRAAVFSDLITAVRGLREVETNDYTLAFNTENPETDNPDVIRQLVQAGADIQFVNEEKHTLEEVYLNLIGDKASSAIDEVKRNS